MNGYMTVQETAEKWGVTTRQVQVLCKENRIEGVSKMSRIWVIPENAEKPTVQMEINETPKKIDLSKSPWKMLEFFAFFFFLLIDFF